MWRKTFNAQDAKKNSNKITDKIAKEQLKKVLIFIKYNSINGKNKVEYGWFYNEKYGKPLNRLDKLHPEVITELTNRGFNIGPSQKVKVFDHMIEADMPYIKHEITW